MNLLELIPAFEAFGVVLVGLHSVQDARNRRDDARNQKYKDAVQAIGTAADETQTYLIDSENRKDVDPSREIHLSSLWRKAFLELREFDPELAQRCKIKAGYWQEPAKLREKEIAEAQIRLKTILKEVDRLMDNQPK